MSNTARLKEAAECERKAEDCMKTSMIKLKFKPDFDGAASAMERASVCYRYLLGKLKNLKKSIFDLKI